MSRAPECRLDDDGRHFLWSHECLGTQEVDGEYVRVTEGFSDERLPLGPPRGWTVESTDPLTISPSIFCHMCGTHGFWRNGQWMGV